MVIGRSCADGIRMVSGWYPDGIRMVSGRSCADGIRMVSGWYPDGIDLPNGRSAHQVTRREFSSYSSELELELLKLTLRSLIRG